MPLSGGTPLNREARVSFFRRGEDPGVRCAGAGEALGALPEKKELPWARRQSAAALFAGCHFPKPTHFSMGVPLPRQVMYRACFPSGKAVSAS